MITGESLSVDPDVLEQVHGARRTAHVNKQKPVRVRIGIIDIDYTTGPTQETVEGKTIGIGNWINGKEPRKKCPVSVNNGCPNIPGMIGAQIDCPTTNECAIVGPRCPDCSLVCPNLSLAKALANRLTEEQEVYALQRTDLLENTSLVNGLPLIPPQIETEQDQRLRAIDAQRYNPNRRG